ncbi:hypothetical protein GCM10017559_70240 [Streptosporangium longisporum]|uniref:DUF397 domain-containing protein n=1 Tax=Streptosporangium longisporum TaxID=46187 RepID=A0ABP6L830_9ACTN
MSVTTSKGATLRCKSVTGLTCLTVGGATDSSPPNVPPPGPDGPPLFVPATASLSRTASWAPYDPRAATSIARQAVRKRVPLYCPECARSQSVIYGPFQL